MKLGIMSAMDQENHLLVEALESGATTIQAGGRTYTSGSLWGHDVVLVSSRWGKVAASATATQLIASFGVNAIIFTGVAGGIDRTLNVGDVVVANSLVQHDMDAQPMFPRFEVPGLGLGVFSTDKGMAQQAVTAATDFFSDGLNRHQMESTIRGFGVDTPKVIEGLIASGDCFVANQATADSLASDLPELACVEMEGAAVAQICHEYDIPVCVIRTISDAANEEASVDFLSFVNSVASTYSLEIVKRMLGTAVRS